MNQTLYQFIGKVIETGFDNQEFMLAVERQLADGWTLVGGISATFDPESECHILRQALTKTVKLSPEQSNRLEG